MAECHVLGSSYRLEVYYGEAPVMAEASVAGRMAEYRAEILRLCVLRDDLRAPE